MPNPVNLGNEIIKLGVNKFAYCSDGFAVGVKVTAYVFDPDFKRSKLVSLKDWGDGVYSLKFDFTALGRWLILIHENGISKLSFCVYVGML